MIILLGVTINFVRNGGLLDRAKQASTQYQIEADREMLLADVVAALDIDGKVDKRMLNTLATADGFNISGEDFPITATSKSGNEFSVSENGEITYTGEGEYVPNTQNSDLDYLRTYINKDLRNVVDGLDTLNFNDSNITVDESFDFGSPNTDANGDVIVPIRYNGKTYSFIVDESSVKIINVVTGIPRPGDSDSSSGSGSDSGSGSGNSSDSGSSSDSSIEYTMYSVNISCGNGINAAPYSNTIREGDTLNVTFTTESDNYDLPSEITVSMGGTILSVTDYTWNPVTGMLTVPNVTGEISISTNDAILMHNITFVTTNVSVNGIGRMPDGGGYGCTATPADNYVLPDEITVEMGGTTLSNKDYTWNKQTGNLSIESLTGDLTITITGELKKYNVTQNLTNVTGNGASIVSHGDTYQCTYTPSAHYRLPSEITVRMGTKELGKKDHYTWDSQTGTLSLLVEAIDNIDITVTGEQIVRDVTLNTTNVTSNGANTVNDGATYEATFTASAHYSLPSTITVVMGGTALGTSDYTWNNETGALAIANVSGNISITVTGEQIVRDVTLNTTNVTTNGASTVNDGATYEATFTANAHYRLPSTIEVSMGGQTLTSSDYTWNSETGALSVPNVSGNITVTVVGEQIVRDVTLNTTNVTANGASTVNDGATYEATFTANAHYTLPTTITVTMGGNTLTSSDYTWNSETGALTIPDVSGNLSITVTGEQIVRDVTLNTTNVTSNGASTVNDGATYEATFTASAHYNLPSTITVVMGGNTLSTSDYTWNNETGALSIPDVSGNLSITVTGEQVLRNVTLNMANATTNGASTVADGGTYSCTFTPSSGYTLLSNITVTMGGTTLSNSQYTWDYQTGALSIPNVTGDINITTKTVQAGVREIPYNELENLNDSSSSNTYLQNLGTNLKDAIDDGQVSKVLAEYIDGQDTIAVIPAGFTVSTTAGENTISGGLVLRNGQNEFVWMPYTDSTVYVEDSFGPLTGTHTIDGTTYTYDTQEELDYYYGENYYNYSRDFTYAQDKLDIEESINTYRGFIVGRYETTITSAGTIGSMPNETVLQATKSISQTNNKQVRWYGLYKVQKDLYAGNSSVFSSMITSKEWNRIMEFTGYGSTKRGTNTYTTQPDKSGAAYKDSNPAQYDETHNLYDLAGNENEWTLRAYSTDYRTIRGGDSYNSFSASDTRSYGPGSASSNNR